jgi:CYTH domain-containing protein
MAFEIERKYLVNKDMWNKTDKGRGQFYRQGYLTTDPQKTIRVRVTDSHGWLTIKGLSVGATRKEYEYEIPRDEAIELLNNFAVSDITKIRYALPYEGKIWEVDEFLDENEGLILAEIELINEEEPFALPEWVGKDVTGDERYYNSNLSLNPYRNWREDR